MARAIDTARNPDRIDVEARTCTAEPGVTFTDLVSATLRHGLTPIVVPELRTITIGGAVSGCSLESMSFKHGGFHDTCLEYEVITSKGKVLHCTPETPTAVGDDCVVGHLVHLEGCRVEDVGAGGGMRRYVSWLNGLLSHEDIVRDLFVESPLAHPSVMMRADMIVMVQVAHAAVAPISLTYRFVSRHPAASASSTEQNQRVPLLICILIWAYQRLVGW